MTPPLTGQVKPGARVRQVPMEEESEEDEEESADSSQPSETYVCVACHAEFDEIKVGKCSVCGAWSSIKKSSELEEESGEDEEEDEDDDPNAPRALPINEIAADNKRRAVTGISELDRVLGGGAVLGGVTLVAGDPGVGKSTLLLQALASLSALGARTLYVSGEESAAQVALRGRRVEDVVSGNLYVLAEKRVERIVKEINRVRPHVMVIDSVQTIHMRRSGKDGGSGSVPQLRDVTSAMIEVAQANDIATFLVGHVNKEGGIAGPKTLEHLVDTVLAFEGEKGQSFRTLRVQKNRYGTTTEVGIFEMTAEGMQSVTNASEFFLAERNADNPGSIIAATSEGNRSMLIEVQALVGVMGATGGKITSNGVNTKRLEMVLGVLEKALEGRCALVGRDIFVNIPGGVTISEPALDLPMALAVASSLLRITLPTRLIAFGEVGLTGEIRGVPRVPGRLSEAGTMGFEGAIVPKSATSNKNKKEAKVTKQNINVLPVRTLVQALEILKLYPPIASLTQKSRRSAG